MYWMPYYNLLDHWNASVDAVVRSFTDFHEFTGRTIGSLTQRQIAQANALGLVSADQAGRVLGMLNPLAGAEAANAKTLTGRRLALVTGGIGGIGTAICVRLAREGHHVVATYIAREAEAARTWVESRRAEGFDADIIECDVTDFDACRVMAETVQRTHGPIGILVNCAGITRDATLHKMDKGAWDAVIDTNLDSVFNVTRHVIDGMVERGFGRIVNISSVNGQKGQFGQTNYSAAKAGMLGFAKSLAREVAEHGITVNSVCPGYVATSMVMAVPEPIREAIVAKVPVGRLAAPEEIAEAVAFIVREDSGYITGSEISVNGGLLM